MLLDVLLQVEVAEGGPVDVLLGQCLKFAEQLFCFIVDSLDVLGVHFGHELVHL